jgi:hypothetical protein
VIEPGVVNVSDLRIARPTRSGPGGDRTSEAEIASGLSALVTEAPATRQDRAASRVSVIVSAMIYLSPVLNAAGAIVPIRVGDLADWTDQQGEKVDAQEIVTVGTTDDCAGVLDVLELAVGRASAVAG